MTRAGSGGRIAPAACLLALLSAGCTTLSVPENYRAVRVDTVNVRGASCQAVGNNGRVYFWRKTPELTAVWEEAFPLVITCEKKGYRKTVSVTNGKPAESEKKEEDLGELIFKGLSIAAQAFSDNPIETQVLLVRIPMKPAEDAPKEIKDTYAKWLEGQKKKAREEN